MKTLFPLIICELHMHMHHFCTTIDIILCKTSVTVALNDPCCCRQDLFKEFGIELSFVATRSGLTRWEEHKEKNEFEMEEDYDYDPDNPREP